MTSLKITSATDLDLAHAFLKLRAGMAALVPPGAAASSVRLGGEAGRACAGDQEPQNDAARVGIGSDVHALADGVPSMWVAGLHFADEPRAWPAIPTVTSPATRSVTPCCQRPGWATWATPSAPTAPNGRVPQVRLLTEIAVLVRAAGFEIGNVAVQVIGNRPRLLPRRREAEELLSATLGAPVSVAGRPPTGWG